MLLPRGAAAAVPPAVGTSGGTAGGGEVSSPLPITPVHDVVTPLGLKGQNTKSLRRAQAAGGTRAQFPCDSLLK